MTAVAAPSRARKGTAAPYPVASDDSDRDLATASLIKQPLPDCSVVFFHHLEKTGGTTLRTVFQRHAQLGEFDVISFINRHSKLSLQMVLHRLHTLVDMPSNSGLHGLRLAVEIHIGGHQSHPYFNKYTLPDLLLIRSLLRAKGCKCNLVTMLRHPLLHHLSWHYHFCNHRVPLCFWRNPADCQARLAMGLTCHDGPRLSPLTSAHESAVSFMWGAFDLVGVTELFDEFVVALADLVGLPGVPAYRVQIVATHTLSRERAQREWTRRTCASLLAAPPDDLMGLIRARMEGSAKNAQGHRQRNGSSSTRGPRGHMECRGYGPCLVDGVATEQRSVDMLYDGAKCAKVTPLDVLSRMCENLERDERIYLRARYAFEADVVAGSTGTPTAQEARARLMASSRPEPGGSTVVSVEERTTAAERMRARVALLREEGRALAARAEAQRVTAVKTLEDASGAKLRRDYQQTSGGGVPWRVNELEPWYQAHERARYSCVECSGDVVPEKDLVGCWPLWVQFAPDEMRYQCNRTWTIDPAEHAPLKYRSKTGGAGAPLPCWQTCWTPMRNQQGNAHCTASCPTDPLPAVTWRASWDALLHAWMTQQALGMRWNASVAFVKLMNKAEFMWNVY